MSDLLMPRRKFLTGLLGLVAAPAVVKAANIMPVKVIQPKWYLADGLPLQSMAHPIRKGSGICLVELREMLRPSLEKMFDDMYAEHRERWDSVFTSEGL
jgi:hypothetical protein